MCVYKKIECISQDKVSKGINVACLWGSSQCYCYYLESLILSCLVQSYLKPFSENCSIYCLPPQSTQEKGRLLIYHQYKGMNPQFIHTFASEWVILSVWFVSKFIFLLVQVNLPVIVLAHSNYKGRTKSTCLFWHETQNVSSQIMASEWTWLNLPHQILRKPIVALWYNETNHIKFKYTHHRYKS